MSKISEREGEQPQGLALEELPASVADNEGSWSGSYSVLLIRTVLVVGDVLAVVLSFLLAYYFRSWLGEFSANFSDLEREVGFYATYWPALAIWPIIFWRDRLYPGLWLSSSHELRRLVQGTTVAGLIVLTLTFITQTGEQFSRAVAIAWWALTIVLLPTVRYALKTAMGKSGVQGDRAVMLGAGEHARLVLESLDRQRLPVLNIVATFSDRPPDAEWRQDEIPFLGSTQDAADWASERGIRTVVVALSGTPRVELIELMEKLSVAFHRVVLIPDLVGLSTAETVARDLEGIHTVELRRNLFLRRNRILKRTIDIAASTAGLAVAVPLGLLIGAAIVLESGRPIFYRHERIGHQGTEFVAFKFRTMVKNADEVLRDYLASNPGLRREWQEKQKIADDPRITKVGRVLRRFSLDEVPQLWNVLQGQMSLVGPRPIVTEEIPKYGEAFRLYTQVRPGITGLWQTRGRSDVDYQERVRLDTYYVRNWSIWLDLIILAKTGWVVATGVGAY